MARKVYEKGSFVVITNLLDDTVEIVLSDDNGDAVVSCILNSCQYAEGLTGAHAKAKLSKLPDFKNESGGFMVSRNDSNEYKVKLYDAQCNVAAIADLNAGELVGGLTGEYKRAVVTQYVN